MLSKQNQRETTLAGFRGGRFSVLVATDVAARGLDISGVELVLQIEPPKDPETYIHRSGELESRSGSNHARFLQQPCWSACELARHDRWAVDLHSPAV